MAVTRLKVLIPLTLNKKNNYLAPPLQNNSVRFLKLLSCILLSLILSSANAFGQNPNEIPESTKELISFEPQFHPRSVRAEEYFRLNVRVNLKPGWHIYSVIPSDEEDAPKPTVVSVSKNQFLLDGPVFETKPLYRYEEILKFGYHYHKNGAELYQNLKLAKPVSPGEFKAEAKIKYQLCTDSICLPTETRVVSATYNVVSGPARAEFLAADRSINPLPSQQSSGNLNQLVAEGFWAFIALAALMGLVSLLTPCVFPMIPITISFFSKQAEGKQSKVIKLALLFSAGIVITYTGFGLLMSVVFGAGSALSIAANPIVNLVIAIVFIIFAFSLMGMFNISLPSGIESFFDSKARSMGGAAGVLLMGFTFTLTAFTCTVQFVGTMLIAAAQGEWIWPLIGMIVFSSVFAFPFFLLAVSPSLIKKMQGKSGAWLGRSKFVLGVLELMASVKFLSNADLVWQTNLISRNTAIAIWLVLLGLILIYLVWTGIRPVLIKSKVQWVSVGVFAILLFSLSRGWNDRSLGSLIDSVLPPPSGFHLVAEDFVSEEEAKSVEWLEDFKIAKTLAIKENKPIFLEFTGYTCVNCRWMEQNILAHKKVHKKLTEDFMLVRLFTDGGDNAKENLNFQIEQYKTVALPFYAILKPDGTFVKSYSGISLQLRDFLDFLTL